MSDNDESESSLGATHEPPIQQVNRQAPDGIMPLLPLPPQPSSVPHGSGSMTALVNAWKAIGERLDSFELHHYERIVRAATRPNPPPAPPALIWQQLMNRGSPFVLRVLTHGHGVNGDGEFYEGDDGDDEDNEDGGQDDEDDEDEDEDDEDDDEHEHEHEHENEEEDDNDGDGGYQGDDGLEDGEGEWHHIGRVAFVYRT